MEKLERLTAASGQKVTTASISAPSIVETATPERISVERDAPTSALTPQTSSTASSAPTNAHSGTAANARGTKTIASSAASPATLLTPMRPGEASGLPSTLCSMQPAQARQAPATSAPSSRGRRICTRIR